MTKLDDTTRRSWEEELAQGVAEPWVVARVVWEGWVALVVWPVASVEGLAERAAYAWWL